MQPVLKTYKVNFLLIVNKTLSMRIFVNNPWKYCEGVFYHNIKNMSNEEEVVSIVEKDKETKLQDNRCSKCHLCTEIPKVPMYGPYNFKDMEPGKTYLWCR